MSVSHRFESSLADQFWFASHEVAVRCCPRLQSSGGLTGAGGSTSVVTYSCN